MLDLVGDKEWQRLFAVLTISDVATSRHNGSGTGGAQGSTAATGRPGTASHRFAPALGAPSDAAAAAAPMQEAPSTPVRVEGSSSQHECDVTPSRRSSFLMGEFNRVQQMRLNTPTSPPAAAAAAAAAAGHVFCNGHVPYMYAHDSMAV
jgi:hypothetical protein